MAPKVGYLGPAGTFSEEALLAGAGPDSVEPVAQATIYDAVVALRRGEVAAAIVPIENSLEGSISVTLDLLADEAEDVQIAGETVLTVRHSLIAAQEVEDLGEIETVLTHPQVPGQCARFLRGELVRARVLPASSTAEAVREVVSEDAGPGRAALGTRLAAEIYGGVVVREDVQDRDDNETRFVWLTLRGDAAGGGTEPLSARRHTGEERRWKTSLVFWGAGAERPGWLVRCLNEFARRGINMTKIESRPRRERLGHYMFFVDLDGGLEGESGLEVGGDVRAAVADVGEMCEEVRVLGSYPAAS
jgi:prephenate dehydratase